MTVEPSTDRKGETLPKVLVILGLILLLSSLIVFSSNQVYERRNVGTPSDIDKWYEEGGKPGEELTIDGRIEEEREDINGYAYRFKGSENFFTSGEDKLDKGDEVRVDVVWQYNEAHLTSYREAGSLFMIYDVIPMIVITLGVLLLLVGLIMIRRGAKLDQSDP